MESGYPLQFYMSDEAKASSILFDAPRDGDAGFDLRSLSEVTLRPGEQVAIKTGLHVAIPRGWVGLVRDRSSMASRKLRTHAGVIDANYRGEIRVVVSNGGSEPITIEKGEKFAQMVVVPHLSVAQPVLSLEELGITERGCGGFGSTGRH